MGNRILMSIKPEFAYAIVDGRKFYEYRRVVPRELLSTAVIYASSPVQRFIGEFDVDTIVTGSLEDVWSRTRHSGGIMRDYYDQYFAGKTEAHAIHVLRAKQYRLHVDPNDIIPNFRPPQSFSYLTDEVYSRIATIGHSKATRP